MYQERRSALAADGSPAAVPDRAGEPGIRIDELVAPARRGDERALTELLVLVRPLVLRYCENRLHASAVSAEDVTQEVCIALLRALPSYQDRGRPFLAFVHAVASHRIASACSTAVRTHERAVAELPEPGDGCERRDQPELSALDRVAAAEVDRLLRRLPGRAREILLLRVVWGLSVRETAEHLALKPESVRLNQHRALQALRRMLAGGAGWQLRPEVG
ncbi:sigma-70 family RNA polymerase sigma factor [Pseudonocardia sp. RS010]|uniref:sigma-70 family RNA polymerase sigma factor n=1 Tax=Pseudonocardia sp. RS010 TaxID=3385979 RepID=UPI0039A21B21